ncbi:hypothetical protein TTHERM_00170390 (macronuclear) [Tetrahymena thermophila SB210]|uniref:Uncharacterized protein n=1 Tax=Tetrahymena thermophila (strain SB210) TaxID=312017 RepID=Q22TI7_TETTS|nr:hypothetical protein TTHERM_00170390 [Tetrahymena thermophila SB210]EAR88451.2 hypothetical protein TTHERM_00170390 [Tetrahymena thermophila SB210]|eukprot:XP_001008696.2 hypothetical protein TTHERM_00170390 [Tetrahymena thermophila SB210]
MSKILEQNLRQISKYPKAINFLLIEALEKKKSDFEVDPNYIGQRLIMSDNYDQYMKINYHQLLQFKIFDKKEDKKKCIEIFVDDGKETNFIDKLIKHTKFSQSMLDPNVLRVYDSYYLDNNQFFYLIEYEYFDFTSDEDEWNEFKSSFLKFNMENIVQKIYGKSIYEEFTPQTQIQHALQKNIDEQFSIKLFAIDPFKYGIYEKQYLDFKQHPKQSTQKIRSEEILFHKNTFSEFLLKSENKYAHLYSEIIKYLIVNQNGFSQFTPLFIDSNILTFQAQQENQNYIDFVIERFQSMEEAIKKKETIDQVMIKLNENQIYSNIQKYEIIQINQDIFIVAIFDFNVLWENLPRIRESDLEKQIKLYSQLINTVQIKSQLSLIGDIQISTKQLGEQQIYLSGYLFFQNSFQLSPDYNYKIQYKCIIQGIQQILKKITIQIDVPKQKIDQVVIDLVEKYFQSLNKSDNQIYFQQIISSFKAYEKMIDFKRKFQLPESILIKPSIQNASHIGICVNNPQLDQIPNLIQTLKSNQELYEIDQQSGLFQNINIQNSKYSNMFSNSNITDNLTSNSGGLFKNLKTTPVHLFSNIDIPKQTNLDKILFCIEQYLRTFNINEESLSLLKEQIVQIIDALSNQTSHINLIVLVKQLIKYFLK